MPWVPRVVLMRSILETREKAGVGHRVPGLLERAFIEHLLCAWLHNPHASLSREEYFYLSSKDKDLRHGHAKWGLESHLKSSSLAYNRLPLPPG